MYLVLGTCINVLQNFSALAKSAPKVSKSLARVLSR